MPGDVRKQQAEGRLPISGSIGYYLETSRRTLKMLARIMISLAFFIYLLGITFVFGAPRFSLIERSLFLTAAIIWVATRKIDKYVLFILFSVIFYTVCLGFFTNYPQFSWAIYFAGINQFLIIYLFLCVYPEEIDQIFYYKLISYLAIISLSIGIIYQTLGVYNLFQREFASGLYRLAGSLVPAYLSAFAMNGMIASLLLVIEARRRAYIGMVLANLLILLLAGGRIAFAVAVAMAILMIIFSNRLRSDRKIISIASGFLVFGLLLIGLGGNIIQRFFVSGDNGRDMLWAYTYSLADKYPFGIGFGGQFWSTPQKIIAYTGSGATHNDFIRLSAELGYGGMVAFYLLLTMAVARIWWRGARNALPWISYAGFLILSLTDNVLASPCLYILLVLGSFASSPGSDVEPPDRPARRLWRMGPEMRGRIADPGRQ